MTKEHRYLVFVSECGSQDWTLWESGESCYRRVPIERSWDDARVNCAGMGANLVTIDSAEEHFIVKSSRILREETRAV